MECHVDRELDMERDGKMVSLFVEPEVLEHSVHAMWSCVDCHEGYDPDSIPHVAEPARVNCLLCHDDEEMLVETHRFHLKFAEQSLVGVDATVSCTECHGGHDILGVKDEGFKFLGAGQVNACGTCHEAPANDFRNSEHMVAGVHAPSCISCHQVDIVDQGGSLLEQKKTQSRQCMDCHMELEQGKGMMHIGGAAFLNQWVHSVHGRALENGNAEAASCVDCHGSHQMLAAMNSDSNVNKFHIVETCQKCHETEAHDFNRSVHATALQAGVWDSPGCSDCHGEHLILDTDDPRSPVSPRNLSQQLCGECHGSVRLSRKYGLSADRFDTFADSYHGLSVRGGSVEVVNCASCHGYHTILPSSHPDSMVHKDNIVATCGECHPKASELYSSGKVHVSIKPVRPAELGRGWDATPQWVATLYTILIVVVVGGMVVHNLLDFFKKVRRKVKGHRHGVVESHVPHRLYLRMTLNERIQHGVLVISFVILVITGFMLRYPESWWVQGLRNLSSHAFELRSLTHRIAGVVMLVAGVWHIAYLMLTVRGRELFRELLPRWKDATDMIGVLRYNLGLSKHKPAFERFSYIEKTEYWAMLWGSVLMGLTGVLLWADQMTINYFGKVGFDVAHVIHFYEAVLATLAIIVWHFYFVIFNPDVYPMNLSWLTGYLSEEEMLDEHPAWLEKLKKGETGDTLVKEVDDIHDAGQNETPASKDPGPDEGKG
jgi:cytochrome b subunit of formate dehydrogenase